MILGIDISNYQAGIDLAVASRAGLQFCFAKTTQGASYRNPSWPTFRDSARANDMTLAAYHYLDVSNADRQAANCAGWIGDKTTPIALDWEAGGGNWANLLAVLAAFRRAGLNVRLLYTGPWYHQSQGSPDMSGCGLALWKSRYPTTNPGTPAGLYANVPQSYWAPLGGLETRLLQFTDRALVAGKTADCSAFLGTRDELAALLGITGGTELTPEEHQMLVDLHDRVCRLETAWGGGVTDANNTPYDMRLLVNRIDVECHQARADIADLKAFITSKLPKAP